MNSELSLEQAMSEARRFQESLKRYKADQAKVKPSSPASPSPRGGLTPEEEAIAWQMGVSREQLLQQKQIDNQVNGREIRMASESEPAFTGDGAVNDKVATAAVAEVRAEKAIGYDYLSVLRALNPGASATALVQKHWGGDILAASESAREFARQLQLAGL